jgi:hypothetical protein
VTSSESVVAVGGPRQFTMAPKSLHLSLHLVLESLLVVDAVKARPNLGANTDRVYMEVYPARVAKGLGFRVIISLHIKSYNNQLTILYALRT